MSGTCEILHASTVCSDGRAVLISGSSGSGKSDLALRLIDRGFVLISDDQTIVTRDSDRLLASAPPNIAGKLEIRGIGIIEMAHEEGVPIALAVELGSEIERLPDRRERPILGLSVPLIGIDPRSASAPFKVALALDRLGLRFA